MSSRRLSGGQFEHPSPSGWGEALAAMLDAMRLAVALLASGLALREYGTATPRALARTEPRRAPAFVGSPFHEVLADGRVPEGFESVCEADGVAVLRAPRPAP